MSDLEHWVGVIAPMLIGLALVTYSLLILYRVREQFFTVTRGIVVTLFITTVALLWLYETTSSLATGEGRGYHPLISVSFVIVTSWLSVWIVAVTTQHRRLFTVSAFKDMVFAKPVNPITVWGTVGLLVIITTIAAGSTQKEALADNGWLLAVVLAYLLVSIAFDVAMPVSAKRRGELKRLAPEEKLGMALLASSWVGIPSIELFFDLYLRSVTDVSYDLAYSWMMLAMLVILLRSVMSRRFTALVVDAEVEMSEQGGFRSYDIPRGVYLFEDETSKSATKLFAELVTLPLRPDVAIPEKESATSDTLAFLIPKGLMITRVFPERIREEYHLQVTPIIWLTESTGDRKIPPTSIALMTDALIRVMEGNPNSIVLVDGVEYLLTFNDFNRVLRSLDSLNETTWITKSRLIIAINPKAFDSKQIAMLERDRIVINGEEGLEELK
ncbi:MAG: DUF835 domain-containing protein, partial [Thermoplasmata archaeon]